MDYSRFTILEIVHELLRCMLMFNQDSKIQNLQRKRSLDLGGGAILHFFRRDLWARARRRSLLRRNGTGAFHVAEQRAARRAETLDGIDARVRGRAHRVGISRGHSV